MSDPTNPLDWVSRAEEDYGLARSALRHKTPLVYGATFHAQQCAEKYLKALLIAQNQPFPKTHDLITLVDLCQRHNIAVPINQNDLQRLSSYSVLVRYPGSDPTLQEAQEALKVAQAIRKLARRLLNLP